MELRTHYHKKLSALCAIQLPTPDVEVADPAAADSAYEACVRTLRERTRDRKKFRLVFSENINYGFRRNLWAMKPGAVLIAVLGLLGSALRIYIDALGKNGLSISAVAGTLLSTVLLTWWLVRITRSWVRVPAEAYAERLLGALDKLERQHGSASLGTGGVA